MYADTGGSLYPYFHDFSQEVQLILEEIFHSHPSPSSMTDSSFISDYDKGGEGDLFKAPETIFEEPTISLDTTLADQDLMQSAFISESLLNDDFFDKILYECKNDILVNNSADTQLIDEFLDSRVPALASEIHTEEKHLIDESEFQKSVSTGSLNCSTVPISDSTMAPGYLGFLESGFGAAYGMRRAFSEGDIKTLGNMNISHLQSSIQWPGLPGWSCNSENRQQKLTRYRIKKLKRNYGRKIQYACRKTLADTQPRIRGRFVSKANDSNGAVT